MAKILPSPLLRLPGELRNRIYRLCLVSDPVIINATTFPEPPLLSTCKDIRKEGSTIFYHENELSVLIHSYNSSPFMVMANKIHTFDKFCPDLPVLGMRTSGQPSWRNLEIWLRRRHASAYNIPSLQSRAPVHPTIEVVRAMMAQVVQLQDMPWEEVRSLMQPLRKALMATDDRWANEDVV